MTENQKGAHKNSHDFEWNSKEIKENLMILKGIQRSSNKF